MNKTKRRVRDLIRELDDITSDWEPIRHEIMPAVQDEALRHPGQWVAATRKRFLVSGDSSTAVYAAARNMGVEVPIIWFVPLPGTSFYFYGASVGA